MTAIGWRIWKNTTSAPDQLFAKAFRVLDSCHPGFKPDGKAESVASIKEIYKKEDVAGLWRLQKNYPHLYDQRVWLSGAMDKASRFAGLEPEEIRVRSFYEDEKLHREIWSATAETAALSVTREQVSTHDNG